MKIAHYSFSKSGGAGRVAHLLAQGMKSSNHDSVHYYESEMGLRGNPFRNSRTVSRAIFDNYIVRKSSSSSLLTVRRSTPTYQTNITGKDIVHLHWWQGLDLIELRKKNPSARFFASLHDDRAFTGGCHSAGSCDGPLRSCAKCPITRKPFERQVKSSFFQTRTNLRNLGSVTFVAPNEWIFERAKSFGLAELGQLIIVPNPIDPVFELAPVNSAITEPAQPKIGFIAQNPFDENKRLGLAVKSIECMRDMGLSATLEVIGDARVSESGCVRFLGPHASVQIAEYAKEWVALLVTSKQETSPLVIAEMAALGVPCVSAELGGSASLLSELGLPQSVDVQSVGVTGLAESARSLIMNFDATQRANLAKNARSSFALHKVTMAMLSEYEACGQ